MKNRILFAIAFLVSAGMAFAQEVTEPVLEMESHYLNMIAAAVPVLAYLALFFVKKFKSKIPKAIRPVLPSILGLAAGLLGGLVVDGMSAVVAAAIGAATTIIYDVVAGLQKETTPV